MKTDLFQSCGHCCFPNLLAYRVQHFDRIVFQDLKQLNWNSITSTSFVCWRVRFLFTRLELAASGYVCDECMLLLFHRHNINAYFFFFGWNACFYHERHCFFVPLLNVIFAERSVRLSVCPSVRGRAAGWVGTWLGGWVGASALLQGWDKKTHSFRLVLIHRSVSSWKLKTVLTSIQLTKQWATILL